MADLTPATKRQQRIINYFTYDFEVELVKKECEDLKKEVVQLISKVLELETRLGEKRLVWKLCRTHHWKRKTIYCSGTGMDALVH